MYIAKKRLKFGETYREPGDIVPEVVDLPTAKVKTLISAGYLMMDESLVQPEPEKESKKQSGKKGESA